MLFLCSCQVYRANFFHLGESRDEDTSYGILNGFQPSWIILIGCWNQIIDLIGLVRICYPMEQCIFV